MDAARIAERLGLTAMAVRQHLYELQSEKLVAASERSSGIGRPTKYWRLTREADRLFPDAYAELSVSLIGAMKETFGDQGLRSLLESRSARQREEYRTKVPASLSLPAKLKRLAAIRTEEGYMAEVIREETDGFLLVENHCPICAAATACQGFCSTELELFRSVLGPGVTVERVSHIVAGDRRCAYRVCRAG